MSGKTSVRDRAIDVAESQGPKMFAELAARENSAEHLSKEICVTMEHVYVHALASGIEMGLRLNGEDDPPETDVTYRAVFIGGPWHREIRQVPLNSDRVECAPGHYQKHFLGFEDDCMEAVYVWSGMHLEEAMALVMQALKFWTPHDYGKHALEVITAMGRTRLRLSNSSTEVSVDLTKSQIGKLIESLKDAFEATDDDEEREFYG